MFSSGISISRFILYDSSDLCLYLPEAPWQCHQSQRSPRSTLGLTPILNLLEWKLLILTNKERRLFMVPRLFSLELHISNVLLISSFHQQAGVDSGYKSCKDTCGQACHTKHTTHRNLHTYSILPMQSNVHCAQDERGLRHHSTDPQIDWTKSSLFYSPLSS